MILNYFSLYYIKEQSEEVKIQEMEILNNIQVSKSDMLKYEKEKQIGANKVTKLMKKSTIIVEKRFHN